MAIGLAVNMLETRWIIDHQFSALSFAEAHVSYDLGRLAMTIGHLGALLLFVRSGALGWLRRAFAAVGRMAVTNYLTHSVVCGILFIGLGWYGQLERHQLYYVVFAIWAAQLVISPLWLRHFRFGPVEWLWRSLTYMKRAADAPAPARRHDGAALALLALAAAGAAPATMSGASIPMCAATATAARPRRVHVYRASRTQIEVAKMRDALPQRRLRHRRARPRARRGDAARRRPAAARCRRMRNSALLTYDPAARRVDAAVTCRRASSGTSVAVPDRPWHLYDYDLASLTITAQYRPDRRADFSFGLPLVWSAPT